MQELKQIFKKLTDSDTADTEYVVYTADSVTGDNSLVQLLNIQNNDAISQVVTLHIQKYIESAYETVLSKAYTVLAGDIVLPTNIMGHVLLGDASNPDRLVVEFNTSMGAGDSIVILGSLVSFPSY